MRATTLGVLPLTAALFLSGCGEAEDAENDVETSSPSSSSSASPTPSTSPSAEPPPTAKVRLPGAVGPWKRAGGARDREQAVVKVVRGQDPDANKVAAGIYEDANGSNSLVIVIITKPVADPARTVATDIGALGVQGYDRFMFGGSGSDLGCGTGEAGAESDVSCAYADANHVIYLTNYAPDVKPVDVARLTIEFRDAALST